MSENKKQVYEPTGTTRPIFVPRETSGPVKSNEHYFLLRIHSAQVAFKGSFWVKSKHLTITSSVQFGEDMKVYSVQRTRRVEPNEARELGLSPNLIDIVPAIKNKVSVKISYILNKKNYLASLGTLINSDSLHSVLSLAPGAAPVAKAVGGIADELIKAFIPAEELDQILEFEGDFNIGEFTSKHGPLQDGYYVILGSQDEDNPLPKDPLSKLEITERGLISDGKPITQLSYVVLDVSRLTARGEDQSSEWSMAYRKAKTIAKHFSEDMFSDEKPQDVWKECLKLLRKGETLLFADRRYLQGEEAEAHKIYWSAYYKCQEYIKNTSRTAGIEDRWQPDWEKVRDNLGIPPDDALLDALDIYDEQLRESEETINNFVPPCV